MSPLALPAHVREFFTLAEANRVARAFPEEARASLQHDLAMAMQKREAAQTLWPRGAAAEALELQRTALVTAGAALDAMAERVTVAPDWLTRARSIATEANRQIADVKLPRLESEVEPSHQALFERLDEAMGRVEEAVGRSVASTAQLALLRRRRIVITLLVGVALAGALTIALRKPPFSHAEASGALNEHIADHAIDGDTGTWWVLPSEQPGWIDLTLRRKRSVGKLRIVGGNAPWNDQLTKDAHIEAFLDGKLVKATDVTFPIPAPSSTDWTEVPLDAPTCDKIGITLRSAHRGRAAIGEVEIP